ncbi:transglutaminaseTgpA domain-containing protein [Streptomyces sp. NPDC060194]|uniref:transglutaminase family protein n=1 Tax=Streptomyces sp. NPDC060194 TaxID=3347069 RepID=UPI00366418C6
MSGRARLTAGAYAATLLAALSLLPLVDPAIWLFQAAFLLAVQTGAGVLARRVPLARPLTVLVQALVTLLLVTLVFAHDRAVALVLPGPDAFARLGDLLRSGFEDVGQYSIPAPDTDGITLMLVGGVLVVGLLVDALAVTYRSAAPAGLPLLALYSVAAGLSRGAGWVWFVLAAAGYLLLLLAEGRDRLSQWGRVFGGAAAGRRFGGQEAEGGAVLAPVRTGRRIGAVALGIALVVPASLPAMEGGLLAGSGNGTGALGNGGTISAVNPLVALQDNLNQPVDREVLRYRTDSQAIADHYLRIVSLDQFDGTEWKPSERPVEDVPGSLPPVFGLDREVKRTEIRTSLTADDKYAQDWLPMPYPPTRVEGLDGRWRYEPVGRTLVGDRGQKTSGQSYTVRSLIVEPTRARLAAAGPPPAAIRREYTRVPGSLPPVVAETARRVTAGADNDYERAVALQDWFTTDGGFLYDTQVRAGSGARAIANFLKQKQGFCVHFSFSMAAMARTLGIPSRVAVGFTPGALQADGSMSVGLRDAHAWPELYFEGVGWTRFEPTPSRGSEPDYTREEAPAAGSSEAPAPRPSSSAAAPSAEESVSSSCPPSQLGPGVCGPTQSATAAQSGDGGPPWGTVLGVGLLAVLVVLLPLSPMLWRIRVRAARLGSSGGRTPADAAARTLAAWQEVNDAAWDHGILPDEAQTPRTAAARIARIGQLDAPAAQAAHRVALAVEHVLYAPEPRQAAGLADDVGLIAAGLRAGSSRSLRLRALLAPRSAARVAWALSGRWARLTGGVAERLRGWTRFVRPGQPGRQGG